MGVHETFIEMEERITEGDLQFDTELLNSLTKQKRIRPSKNDIIVRGKSHRNREERNEKPKPIIDDKEGEGVRGQSSLLTPSVTPPLNDNTQDRGTTSTPDRQTAGDFARQLRKEKFVERFIQDKIKKIASSSSSPESEEATIEVPVQFGKARFAYLNKGIRYLDKTSPWSLARLIKNLIIYEDDDLIIVDKPYGLPCHGGPGVNNSVTSILPHLEKLLYKKQPTENSLHLIHRLDKETTGIMLLGKNKPIAVRLQNMFKNREILKVYWVVCLGVPEPSTGLINIPIVEAQFGNMFKMVTQPTRSNRKLNIDVARGNLASPSAALTNYRILTTPHHRHCSLVELRPQTGLKHQIRVHLSQGLGCPVLGDHKYSHTDKLAPQIVHPYILKVFGIPQSKARHIPMHLHARQLIIPDYQPDKNLNVTTPPPIHFLKTLKRLKLLKR